jgi:hypothetical protein
MNDNLKGYQDFLKKIEITKILGFNFENYPMQVIQSAGHAKQLPVPEPLKYFPFTQLVQSELVEPEQVLQPELH